MMDRLRIGFLSYIGGGGGRGEGGELIISYRLVQCSSVKLMINYRPP